MGAAEARAVQMVMKKMSVDESTIHKQHQAGVPSASARKEESEDTCGALTTHGCTTHRVVRRLWARHD